jgi:ABC-type uncharacterized transport system auxiliary subunit
MGNVAVKRVALIAVCASLSGCSEKPKEAQKDAFEVAKAHVWGNKYNGCDYQTILFSDTAVRMINSDKRIKEIAVFSKGATGSPLLLPQESKLDVISVKSSEKEFTIIGDKNNTSMARYSISGDSLIFESIYSLGRLKKIQKRKGIGNQSDFVSCGIR